MSQRKVVLDQRGVAMLLELILVAAVIAAFAIIGVRSYQSSHKVAVVAPEASSKKSHIANGNPDNAVDSILESASRESSTSSKDDASSSLNSTITAASGMEGGINESSY